MRPHSVKIVNRMRARGDVYGVVCPTCGASAWELCKLPSGRTNVIAHVDRGGKRAGAPGQGAKAVARV